ncbi:MAG: ABC transporter ATP-binding protein [Parcubacteria group bacterium]|nr:ABC transporter ATP-binding protein [Parcubacteria group bacterium]
MQPIISLHNISKHFEEDRGKRLTALQNIDMEIFPGEFFVILGPSGSGKSTLLRIMSGLEKNYEGILALGDGIESSDTSFVFQQFALLPWLTVAENVELQLLAGNIRKETRRNMAMRELKILGLEKFADAYPKELSGGMRQRVGLARALAAQPKIIFMDEPFSEVDSFTAEELRKEVLNIWGEKKITIIMVTHLIEEALQLADRIAVLTPRPGKIEKIITNNLPRPREKRSQDLYRLEDELYKLIKP